MVGACWQEKHGTSYVDSSKLLQQAAEEEGSLGSENDEFRDRMPLKAGEYSSAVDVQ